jgi:hypothetical protein
MMTEPLYDPSAYNVDDVKGYLDTVDDAERARVLEVEAAGQNRKGLASYATPAEAPAEEPAVNPAAVSAADALIAAADTARYPAGPKT